MLVVGAGMMVAPAKRDRMRASQQKEFAVPHIIVKLWTGKSQQQKQRLADAITRDVTEHLGYGDESVSVAFEEIAAADWKKKVYEPDIVGKDETLLKKPGYSM